LEKKWKISITKKRTESAEDAGLDPCEVSSQSVAQILDLSRKLSQSGQSIFPNKLELGTVLIRINQKPQ
jgi:hypothetical protein